MDCSPEEFQMLCCRSTYIAEIGRTLRQVDGKIHFSIPPVLDVTEQDCCSILKLLTSQKLDSMKILTFPVKTLLLVADHFSTLSILALLENWFIYKQPLKSPEYLSALRSNCGQHHERVFQFMQLLHEKYPEIPVSFMAKSGIRPLKLKLRSATRSHKYLADLQKNTCPCCKHDCYYKPYEKVSSSRGASTPCCGRFIHGKCVTTFVKYTFCPACSTSLDGGKPFTECETLHATMLRCQSRDRLDISRSFTLPNLKDKYCLYKHSQCDWDCSISNCSDPLQPKFMITPETGLPNNLQKQC
jgi:hypothetical protein